MSSNGSLHVRYFGLSDYFGMDLLPLCTEAFLPEFAKGVEDTCLRASVLRCRAVRLSNFVERTFIHVTSEKHNDLWETRSCYILSCRAWAALVFCGCGTLERRL